MTVISVYDNSEAVELNILHHLYLKPKAKLIITVILPEGIDPCKPISNWEILEQLKYLVDPDHFSSIKVSRSTKEYIRIEGEADTKYLTQIFLEKLHGQILQVNGFSEPLLVEVTEAPSEFQVTQELPYLIIQNERDPDALGENDTAPPCIYLEGLPCKWFLSSGSNIEKPSEDVLRTVFEKYGKLINVDIPILDPYREDCVGIVNLLNSGGLQTFDAFLQYEDHKSSANAVQSLQGMKLMFTGDDGKSLACDIKVTLDTTEHFSEEAINKRNAERLKLQELEQQRKQEKEQEEAERKKKIEERKCRARKRKAKLRRKAQKQKECEDSKASEQEPAIGDGIDDSQEWEDRKLLLAQRRVEAIKLLSLLLDKVNDVIQERKLNEELPDCNFMECIKENSLSTLSGNETPLSLPVMDEEESSRPVSTDESENKPYSPGDVLPLNKTHKFKRRVKKDLSPKAASNKNFKCETPQKEFKNSLEYMQTQNFDHDLLKMSHSQDSLNKSCCKKLKIYETDEFTNYLLNYYHCPEYARLFLETKDNVSKPLCQRVVYCNGNNFQIKLKNMDYHYTEMKLGQETEYASGRWKITVQKSQEDYSRRVPKESQKHSVTREQNVSLTKTRSYFHKGKEHIHHRPWDDGDNPQNSDSDHELKDVLEEISSTSEYFSEEQSEAAIKNHNIRKTPRKQGRTSQNRKSKPYRVSEKSRICHHEDILGHFLNSYSACKSHKKCTKCNPIRSCNRTGLQLRYETQTSETSSNQTGSSMTRTSESDASESDTSEEERMVRHRKRLKKQLPISCLEDDKRCCKGKFPNSVPFVRESSSSDSRQGNRAQRKRQIVASTTLHKTMRHDAKHLRREKRPPKEMEYYSTENESESYEHDVHSWNWSSSSRGHQTCSSTTETENLICPKESFKDYLDWEHHFYSGGGFHKDGKYKS